LCHPAQNYDRMKGHWRESNYFNTRLTTIIMAATNNVPAKNSELIKLMS